MASAATPLLQLLLLRPSFNSSSHFRPLSLHTRTRNPFFSPPFVCLSTSPLLHTASDLQPEEPKPLTQTRTEPPLATFRSSELPNLTVKEKKELASYAHSLGKKLKSQQVGKSGVTPSAAASFVENLESNELLKLKVHNSCPGELPDVVRQLEEATGSIVVGQIDRSVILYRPSLTKMKEAERKKQQVQRFRKLYPPKPYDSNGQVKPSNRGRRGSSRVNSTGFEN